MGITFMGKIKQRGRLERDRGALFQIEGTGKISRRKEVCSCSGTYALHVWSENGA